MHITIYSVLIYILSALFSQPPNMIRYKTKSSQKSHASWVNHLSFRELDYYPSSFNCFVVELDLNILLSRRVLYISHALLYVCINSLCYLDVFSLLSFCPNETKTTDFHEEFIETSVSKL